MNQVLPINVGARIKADLLRLFVSATDDENHLAALRTRVQRGIESLREAGVVHQGGPLPVAAFQSSSLPVRPSAPSAYFEQLLEDVTLQSVDLSSPLCLGHMSGVVPQFAGVLAELVVLLNQNLVKRDASRALTLVERQVLGMMHRLVYGRPDQFYRRHIQDAMSTLGVMTTGGTLGNLTALWIARNACFPKATEFPGVEAAGLPAALAHYGYDEAVIVGSRLMHYSIQKAAGLLGLGCRGVIQLPLDSAHRLDVNALRDCLADCARTRRRVLAIVGLAGSTDCGSIDPLAPISRLAHRAGIFFHVDAAWGGPLLFSARQRTRLAGIAAADAVVIDGHKQMYLPLGTSMLLLRNPASARVIEKHSHYILQNGSGDLGQRSLEGSRAGAALFLHAALHLVGVAGYGFLIDENCRKARLMAKLVAESPEFELLLEPETNIVLYRYLPRPLRPPAHRPAFTARETDRLNQLNERLQQQQARAGRTFTARTIVEHRRPGATARAVVALRAVLANPLVEECHIRQVLADQAMIGAELERLSEC